MNTSPGPAPKARAGANWIWLGAYLVTIVAVVASMISVRRVALREMSTPEALAQWQAWRDAQPNQADAGPVARRRPPSPEPPTLVLLRDYFGVMMAGALVFSSLLFGAIMIATRGAFSSSEIGRDARSRETD